MVEEKLTDRLKQAREAARLTQSELAEMLGVAHATVNRYEKGHREPDRAFIDRMARSVGVNVDWLLTGEGPKHQQAPTHTPPAGPGGFVAIPVYEPEVAAGVGAEVLGEKVVDWLLFKNEWIRSELHSVPSNLYLLYVTGPSMEPTLASGDIVLVEKLDNTPPRDGVHVIRVRNSLLVKRLQVLPGGKIDVTSDNPAFRPFTVDLADMDDVQIVGRVLWAGKRF